MAILRIISCVVTYRTGAGRRQYIIMLWSQITYGVYFTTTSTMLRCPGGGRKNRTIFCQFFRHRTVPGVVYAPITLRPRIPRIAKNRQISGFVRIRNTPITLRPRNPRISKNWQFSEFVVESLSDREVPTSFVYIRSDRFVVNQGLHESPNDLRISTNA